jgi:methionine synthase II (cobalamin-independent)
VRRFIERNDMVEYFGEQLDGFAFTKKMAGYKVTAVVV